jgi:hypothetical protein
LRNAAVTARSSNDRTPTGIAAIER